MRIAPTHGVLHGPEGKCPPLPYVTVEDDEGDRLIRRGLAVEVTDEASVGAADDGEGEGGRKPVAPSPEPPVSGEPKVEPDVDSEEQRGPPPADTPEEQAKLQEIADHIELLGEDDFVKTGPRAGRPKVAPLAAALGREDLTAEEVDAAFELHKA